MTCKHEKWESTGAAPWRCEACKEDCHRSHTCPGAPPGQPCPCWVAAQHVKALEGMLLGMGFPQDVLDQLRQKIQRDAEAVAAS